MQLVYPEFETQNELFKHLVENKKKYKSLKKSQFKEAPAFGFGYSDKSVKFDESVKSKVIEVVKAPEDEGAEALNIKVIANLAGWMDYDEDVILRGAYNKTIADKKNNRPTLRDHGRTTKHIIGDTLEVYTQDFTPQELNLNTDVMNMQGLMFNSRIQKDYDSETFAKYRNGAIKEHSIGLRYIKLDLAINNPDYEEEFKVWNEFYKQIINKDRADEMGYFWAVKEIDVLENSAVIWGSSSMTPVVSMEEEKTTAKSIVETSDKNKEVVANTSKENEFLNYFKHL